MAGRSWLTKSLVNINIIVDFFMDPCDAPLSAYLETLFPALMDMLVDLYAFDVSEYQEQRPFSSLSPKLRKSESKVRWGSKGGGWKRFKWFVDVISSDPGELLGKRMAKHFGGTQRILTGGTSHLWLLGGALQRGMFYIWFVSRIGEFFYDWYMGLITKGFCSEAGTGMFLAGEGLDTSHALFGWKPLLVWTVLKQRGAPNWSVTYGTSGGYATMVSIRLTASQVTDHVGQFFEIRASVDDGKGDRIVEDKKVWLAGLAVETISLSFEAPKWSNFVFEVRNDAGLVNIHDIYIHAHSRQFVLFKPVQPWPRDFRGHRTGPTE